MLLPISIRPTLFVCNLCSDSDENKSCCCLFSGAQQKACVLGMKKPDLEMTKTSCGCQAAKKNKKNKLVPKGGSD